MLNKAFAVILAGVVGTLANAMAVAAVVGADKLNLALVPGRYAVAIGLCALLPVLAGVLSGAAYSIAAIAVLTLAASCIAKFVFAAAAPWTMVLAFNLVFAVAALLTYQINNRLCGCDTSNAAG